MHKLGLGIVVVLIPTIFPVINALEQSTSLATCYGDVARNLLFVSMFTPAQINLHDAQVKTYITNYCNFYHEKLGIWISDKDMPRLGNLTDKDIMLSREFEEKYKDTIPQSIKELSSNLIQQINRTNNDNQTMN